MKTILLTGASGFLGQHFLETLSQKDDKPFHVVALHHSKPELASSFSSSSWCTVTQLDLCDTAAVTTWLANERPSFDCCIHTAALSSPKACAQDPDRARAINVPQHFLTCLQNHSPNCHFILLSTDQVYPGTQAEDALYKEDEVLDASCSNVYATTKREMEALATAGLGAGATILRSSIILGPPPPYCPTHTTFLDFCANRVGESTTYWTNEIRSVIAVTDVCAILGALALSSAPPPTTIYNMGGPQAVSRYDMAIAVLTYLGADTSMAVPAIKPDTDQTSPLQIAMDSSKLRSALPELAPFKTLKEMVELTLGTSKKA